MGIFKRAYLYTTRKKGKSLLLFALLLIMATLILTCTSIQVATDTAALNVRQSLKGGFTINAKATDGQLTEGVVQQILSKDGVKPDYNARANAYGEYRSDKGTPLTVRTQGAFQVVAGFEHAGKLMADAFSEKDELFTEQGFELTAGRHITKGDKNVALIHEWLAKKNGLSLGDTFQLALNNKIVTDGSYQGQTVAVKIVGIFTNSVPQDPSNLLSHIFNENVVFTDLSSYSRLYRNTDAISSDYVDFQVDDPAELPNIMNAVKTIPVVNWDACDFQTHDTDYQNAKASLETLSQMVTTMIYVILIVSLILLVLILALWVRGRIHETGVFLSLGLSKRNILFQQITEVLMIAALAFILAFPASTLISQRVGDTLLSQASASEYEVVDLTGGESETNDVELAEIEVSVSVENFAILCIVGSLLCVTAVALSTIPVFRMKPKNILSQMS